MKRKGITRKTKKIAPNQIIHLLLFPAWTKPPQCCRVVHSMCHDMFTAQQKSLINHTYVSKNLLKQIGYVNENKISCPASHIKEQEKSQVSYFALNLYTHNLIFYHSVLWNQCRHNFKNIGSTAVLLRKHFVLHIWLQDNKNDQNRESKFKSKWNKRHSQNGKQNEINIPNAIELVT